MRHKQMMVMALCLLCAAAHAKDAPARSKLPSADAVAPSAATPAASAMVSVTPIYSQLLVFTVPAGFQMSSFEDSDEARYIREMVLQGESLEHWSQMITVTGLKGAVTENPEATPMIVAGNIAGGFKSACPDTYTATGLGEMKIGGHDAFVAFVSCGQVTVAGPKRSEAVLLMAIKGDHEYYTLQWAERGPALETALAFDDEKWSGRLKQLAPVKLCSIVPGEQAPYPSCLQR